ncbi:uncharacterized protein LOC128550862 isoform X1 [Mercenaria mercenaria]|uniref:uncharacterized protein LOC128550862 isoform X1 n=1 Tax=Mercenaria mercenaria TaxID=6596 RepID=UPI00234E8D41|nr:uncharacterized protein LOC128550862 isoform X1 [Mercenaria mercenaria]
MDDKGMCLFFHVSLLAMCSCGFGATERTHETNYQRDNDALKPTAITCLLFDRVVTCTWLLGIQHNKSIAVDTSCDNIRSDVSVQMYFATYIASGSNDYESWKPCPNQRPTSCTWTYTHDSEFYVMVIVNNNRLKTCTGFSIEKIKLIVPKYMDHGFAVQTLVYIENSLLLVCTAFLLVTLAVTVVLVLEPTIRRRRSISLDRSMERIYERDITMPSSRILVGNTFSDRGKIEPKYKNVSEKWFLTVRAFRQVEHEYLLPRSNYTVKDSWTENIYRRSVGLPWKYVFDDALPTDSELQSVCSLFGKRSKRLRNVCAKICDTIQVKLTNGSKVWPAYTLSSDKIVFVVESDMISSDIRVNDFRIHLINSHITLQKESQIVMLREKEILALCYDKYGIETFEKLKQIISKNAEQLMDKHKFINAITPGIAKSIGYLTPRQHKLIETPCISIYVKRKVRNLIPLGEEPIPGTIDNFPTDVIEGKFDFFCNGPNDYHKVIKIGCGIHAGVRTDNGDILGGTLGAFVKHKTFDLCCITSAHVVLSHEELQWTKRYSYSDFGNNETKMVFQPACQQSESFGRVVAASYKEGGHRSPGVEVALIQVQRRKPISGSFPHANTGSGPDVSFVFDSGNVIDATLLRPMTEVYKFGMATGPTTGYLGLQGAAVRVGSNHLDDSNFGVRLYNQLEILPKHNSSFAKIGDSGALVFIGHPHCPAAIGILEGGLPNGKILVTPIIDVLEALKCPNYLHRFEQDSDSGINLKFPGSAEGENIEEDMDYN